MSDAIEVLKDLKVSPSIYISINSFDEFNGSLECEDELLKAIDEALLALEQKEKLKFWLEKESQKAYNKQKDCFDINAGFGDLEQQVKIDFIKEIMREFK